MSSPENSDAIARCLLRADSLRAVAVTSTGLSREICLRHQLTGAVAVGTARATAAGLLLASLTKNEESVTLQIATDEPMGGITVDANSGGRVRAYPRRPNRALPAIAAETHVSLSPLVGNAGFVSVVRDLGMKENFKGQTALVSGEIDIDVEHYLAVGACSGSDGCARGRPRSI